jgi:hypothetical protein
MTPELERRAIAYSHQANEMMRLRRLAAVESEALFTNESKRADASPVPPKRRSCADERRQASPMRPSPRRKA